MIGPAIPVCQSKIVCRVKKKGATDPVAPLVFLVELIGIEPTTS